MGASDHSDNVDIPYTLSAYCVTEFRTCLEADRINPFDSYRKWPATLEQARQASTPTYTAFRGFEWTSDIYGHINVFFSRNVSNAKSDGGTPGFLERWLRADPSTGGGSDGIATFNHPGAKGSGTSDQFNWRDFAYRRSLDTQFVGIETFNDQTDYGSVPSKGNPPPEGWYGRALDRGWHLGAIGAEDLGHYKEDNWGGQDRAKTVILSTGRSEAAIKSAMLERRFYAIKRNGIRISYELDGKPIGSRFDAAPGAPLHVEASVTAPAEGTDLHLDLITSRGQIVATGDETLSLDVPSAADQRYYYVRVRRGSSPGEPIAYSSPIWTTTSLLRDTAVTPALLTTTKPNRIVIDGDAKVRADAAGRVTVVLRCVGLSAISCNAAVELRSTAAGRTTSVGAASARSFGAGFAARYPVLLRSAARAELASKGSLAVTVRVGSLSRQITILPPS